MSSTDPRGRRDDRDAGAAATTEPASPGVLEQEIAEQPAALERQLRHGRTDAEAVARAIDRRRPSCVLMAARGSSDNAARYAQYLLGAHNRLLVSLATPSLFTLYGAPPRLHDAVVIGVSQSGRSPDIVAVLAEARTQGALGIAVTNDPSSPLAEAATLCLPLYAGPEHAVAATKTYVTELCAFAMVSAALEQDAPRFAALQRLPDLAAETLRLNGAISPEQHGVSASERLFVIGRGFNYATAFEVALKIKETGYLVAEAYSSADFRHGPSAALGPGLPVVLIAPSGRAAKDVTDLVALCRDRRAPLVGLADDPAVLAAVDLGLPLPPAVPEWLSPLLAVIPGQLLAVRLARARGLDPDRPRGLSKVTETR